MLMASEESCVRAGGIGLELGLELSLGCGKAKAKVPEVQEQQARILTAKDFGSLVSSEVSSEVSSSSSSSSVTKAIGPGTKRSGEFPSSSPHRQVVGWPPVRAYRLNSLVSHTKPPATEDFLLKSEDGDKSISNKKSLSYFVKVSMDGIPIGRKVDLLAHDSYKALAQSLEEMFRPSHYPSDNGFLGPSEEQRTLGGLSNFILTYEDKDGDWMLVGDVPWEMFVNTVRRLRIMRSDEAKGIAPPSGDMRTRQE